MSNPEGTSQSLTTPQHESYLTVSEVASLLNLAEATVRQLIRDGKLPSLRLTEKIIRVPASGIRALVQGGTQ
ncbi:DNA binding domain-containing protein, excisionase family [Deinococcus reticulitermitis]|uniref:DNA binding domain-containing protein, excisionase family n=1 Tax=Deinococcus reticulitermitis TaxID=856736 RepID=A0A1H7CW59_9DEIO|nr:helix-turn-helix domain-containing protein [Deinococcus reticulitermitis]SEJ91442.1 DNA binding domain-containing protein, excisionase family [Deinococcus reticulitermitis]